MNIEDIIRHALREDIGNGDHTSLATIPVKTHGKAMLLAKDHGIICGLNLAMDVFHAVDSNLQVELLFQDGDSIGPGDKLLTVEGESQSILRAERVVLNFVQRLSGIATATHDMASLIRGMHTRILDTRKTTPLLRELEKYAVRTGGGCNHRMGLYDMIMIKDNHVDFAGGISPAIEAARAYLKEKGLSLKIEIEVRNLKELREALDVGCVDRIMMDNFTPELLGEAVSMIGGRFETEASGGITKESIRAYAATGVDYISVGALTHHIRSLDLSLKAIRGNQE